LKDLLQKVNLTPSCSADSADQSAKVADNVNLNNEGQRKVRHSAAMIGLALSMGATGLLLPNQDDRAIAAETISAKSALADFAANPELGEQNSEPQVAVKPSTSVTEDQLLPKAEINSEPQVATPVIKHEVKEGETLWQLSKNYEVAPEAIAASNKLNSKNNLAVGQTLKIPPVNGIVHEVKPQETVETVSQTYGVKPSQVQTLAAAPATEQLTVGSPVTVPGDVDTLLRNRQETALNNLQKHRKDLVDSLAELRSEETNSQASLPETKTETQTQAKPLSIARSSTIGTTLETESNSNLPVAESQLETAAAPLAGEENNLDFNAPIPIPVPTPANTAPTPIRQEQPVYSNQPITIPVPTPGTASLTPSKQETVIPSNNSLPTQLPKTTTANQTVSEPVGLSDFSQPIPIPVPTPETARTNPSPAPERVVSLPTPVTEIPVTPVPQTLARVDLSQPAPEARASLPTHQVRRGDTLDSIARRYGISRTELARANRIQNPNLIKVNQQLVIPGRSAATNSRQPLTLIPGLSATATNSVTTGNLPQAVNYTQTQPQRQPTSEVAVLPRSNGTLSNFDAPIAIPVELNPEWQKDQTSRQNNTNVRPTATATQTRRPEIQPTVSRVSRNSTDNNRQLMAAAPTETEGYNRMIQVPVGEMVSPELPPLQSPDQYLPNSPQRFNGHIWPAKGVLTSGYGPRWGRMHRGIDIAGPVGTPIVASAPGEVITAGWNSGGYGNLVRLRHSDGSVTLYAHNNRILVRRGQYVEQGQQIAEMGSTGYSTGPHLHFEVHPGGKGAVNPIAFLPKR
jgi:murein DD-endopeptidase MepM/ murein hydrolase activator NlpD